MAEAAVLYEMVEDGVALVTLNRPDNRNAMTVDLLDAFDEAMSWVLARDDLRCCVLAGRGTSFSAGADLRANLQAGSESRSGPERSFAMYGPFLRMRDIDVPVVGALTGHAVGGGFGLALTADLRVAQEDAKYGANFVRIGLAPGMGISYALPRLVGLPRAAELLFTGRLFTGREGLEMGLMNRAVPRNEVLPSALALAKEIAENAPLAVRFMKRAITDGLGWEVARAARAESFAQAFTVGTEDVQEGIAALLDRRKPRFRGR